MTKDEALIKIATVNAMDYEYQAWARKALAQPEQEPVGWAEHGVINWLADKQFNHTSFLYDTPPQRTWVGLTDEDIALIDWESLVTKKDCVQAIEAKLRSKNENR